MKKALVHWTLFGALVVGCGGGGSDPVSDACNRLASCNTVSSIMGSGVTTAAQCTQQGNDMLKSASSDQQSTIKNGIEQCLKQSDCSAFTSCIQGIMVVGSTQNMVCCDDSASEYCSCMENQPCASGETQVSVCPNYGACCMEQQTDLCICSSMSCSSMPYSFLTVSGCP